MKRLFLLILCLGLVQVAVITGADEKTITPEETTPPPAATGSAAKTVHMKIGGMTCKMCSAMITKKLGPLCQAVSIDHQTGDGQCSYDTEKTTPDAISKAITDAGYKVIEIR